MFFSIRVGDVIDRKELMGKLVARQYQRNDMDLIPVSYTHLRFLRNSGIANLSCITLSICCTFSVRV